MSDEELPKDPLSKIRHDLRTPINQIIGYSELLEEDALEKGQQGFVPDLKKVQSAARKLLGLIDEFLAPGKLALVDAAPKTDAPAARAASALEPAPAGEPPAIDEASLPAVERHGQRTI